MLVKMTLNKILSIVNTLVSLSMLEIKKKRLLWMYYGGKKPSKYVGKNSGFSTQSCLKMSIFYSLKVFFSFISHRNLSDRVKCGILKSLAIDNKSDTGALKLEIVLL